MQKQYYGTAERTVGVVERVLTRAAEHPRGFKVRLTCGIVGRCTDLIQRATPRETHKNKGTSKNKGEAEGEGEQTDMDGEMSSDDYLAALEMELRPPPGIRLADEKE